MLVAILGMAVFALGMGLPASAVAALPSIVSEEQFTQQGSKIPGENGLGGPGSGSGFGGPQTLALSADGNTALIGAPSSVACGNVRVYTRSGSTWTQQTTLHGSELGTSDCFSKPTRFGTSAALSADGKTAVIGGPGDSLQTGAAWVFKGSGSTWTQHGPKLTGGSEIGAGRFGASAALSADGKTAVIGGPGDNGQVGATWVFKGSHSTWAQQGAKLTGGEEVGLGGFGTSVALSGKTALIGGPGDDGEAGAVWVFKDSGSTWTQRGGKLTGGEEQGQGGFGTSVALSGKTALIGGPGDNSKVGAAWVFKGSHSTWTQQGAKLTGGEELGQGVFGGSVGLSGKTALIGGRGDDEEVGAAWVFEGSHSTWTQQNAKLTGGGELGAGGDETTGGAFGAGVALSADRKTALIGGPADHGHIGAVWVFVKPA